MFTPSHPTIYDSIGNNYHQYRQPDHRIYQAIRDALGSAKTVCNIGAGAGSYEPTDLEVTAVEPSEEMIRQRINDSKVVKTTAENLPFGDQSFDASMAVLTIHHWLDVETGLREMQRVASRQVIFTFDPDVAFDFWLVRDYFPNIVELDKKRSVPLAIIEDVLNIQSILTVPVPFDCTDGFLAAYWKRPEFYLDPKVRNSISTFAQLPSALVNEGVKRLADDLASGAWQQRYSHFDGLHECDFGYRLVIAESKAT